MQHKINIFSNNCAGGYLHRALCEHAFLHPLYYCGMIDKHFIRLVESFDDMDLSAYRLIKFRDSCYAHTSMTCHHNGKLVTDCPTISYSNGVEVVFAHYESSEENGESFEAKFKRRINKFDKGNLNIFLCNELEYDWEEDAKQKFIALNPNGIKILMTRCEGGIRINKRGNTIIVHSDKSSRITSGLVSDYIKKIIDKLPCTTSVPS